MEGSFTTASSSALPGFLRSPAAQPHGAGAALRAVRQEARQARKAAAPSGPAMTVQPVGVYQQVTTMPQALQELLTRLGSFLSHLFAPTGTPVRPPVTPPSGPAPNGDTNFVISSFNLMRTSMGNKEHFASGHDRMQWTTQILDAHNVSVAGLQEMDAAQMADFKRMAGDRYATLAGDSGHRDYFDSTLAWRKDTWDLVKGGTESFTYYDGKRAKMPYALLRNKQTGQEAYFLDVHNPANTSRHPHQDAYRTAAMQQEAAFAKQLLEQSGLPVFVVGDFNSVKPAGDTMTHQAPLVAANAQTGNRPGIDWIFGSKGVRFSQFSRSRDGLIAKTTDHPVVFAQAHIGR